MKMWNCEVLEVFKSPHINQLCMNFLQLLPLVYNEKHISKVFTKKLMNNQRITNLDFIRGVAVLGILVMNSIIFALPFSAYWNHPSSGTTEIFDWILIIVSEVFIAQKFMGLFSILFGASIVLFIESAMRRGSNLSLIHI